ncbi:dihydrofolate reductase family protein [Mucilaginibacter agri]|uniref:Deaminase n=1 Tax=Mucilaginibacter agri TaxID=2695265 RepID=A0A965ZFT1_9SPHI|nr:RibD family protein [Mucilaginibacter agri]NCD70125.1 deaminase [Mucilaginibacter agri]
MKKPYVICHMMSSVDGRTLTEQWGQIKGRDSYEKTGSQHKADAWMCGRVTMERDFAGDEALHLKDPEAPISRADYIAESKAGSFAVAIDKDGKLNWRQSEIDGDHIISVLTEQVADKYLNHLQQTGISYVFAGKTEIDFKLVLQKLRKLFNIKTLLLEGGGHLNGSMLNAGLIDELSFLHLPIADGTPGTPTLFEINKDLPKTGPTKLKLLSVKELKNDVLWLRYKVK